MQWSRYNVLSGDCVCNLLTGVIVQPESGEVDFSGSADAVRPDLLTELAGDGFVVEDAGGEEKNTALAQIKKRANNEKCLIVLLAPTMRCNNRCPYCYEPGDVKCGKAMSDQVIDLFCKALDECLKQNSFEVVSLEFIGGEPMLGWRVIKKLLPMVQEICNKHRVRLEVEMTSNGQLLTPTKARFLSLFHWKHLQVTLEGTKEIHDQVRVTKGGGPTFIKIISNLLGMNDVGCVPEQVTIRVHINIKDPEDTKALLMFLKEVGLTTKKQFVIRLAVVNASLAKEGEEMPSYDPRIAEIFLDFFEFMKKKSIKGIPEIYSFGPVCYKRRRWSFIIDPLGNLYDCESLLGQIECATGHVRDGLVGKNSDAYFDGLSEKCRECQFLPVCAGACPYYAGVKPDSLCPREFLKKIQPSLLEINA